MTTENLPAEVQSMVDFLNTQADQEVQTGFLPIKVAHSAGLFQSIGFGNGETFEGTILAIESVRALWVPIPPATAKDKALKAFAGNLPLCSSRRKNMKTGLGELPRIVEKNTPVAVKEALSPIIEAQCICVSCPWSQWGSDWKGGRGQQCRLGIRFLIYDLESDTAATLAITPTSLKSWRNYRNGLAGGHFSMVKTKFSLQKIESDQGHYSIVQFTMMEPTKEEVYMALSKPMTYQGADMKYGQVIVAEFLEVKLEREEEFEDTVDKEENEEDDF